MYFKVFSTNRGQLFNFIVQATMTMNILNSNQLNSIKRAFMDNFLLWRADCKKKRMWLWLVGGLREVATESMRSLCMCVCMNWTICSTVFVSVYILPTAIMQLLIFVLAQEHAPSWRCPTITLHFFKHNCLYPYQDFLWYISYDKAAENISDLFTHTRFLRSCASVRLQTHKDVELWFMFLWWCF